MKYYLCGPIDTAGRKDLNIEAFKQAAKELRQNNKLDIVSPIEEVNDDTNYLNIIKQDIVILMECEAIILLPGWPQSQGARRELNIAISLNMKIYYYPVNDIDRRLHDMNF